MEYFHIEKVVICLYNVTWLDLGTINSGSLLFAKQIFGLGLR